MRKSLLALGALTAACAGVVDEGFVDAGFVDAGFVDAGFVDAGFVDAGFVDAGFVDAGFVDAGFVDAGFVDAGRSDGGRSDGADSGLWIPSSTGVVPDQELHQLPLNQWRFVATNTLSDSIGPIGYPTKLGNIDGRRSIIDAWSGAGWDWINQRMYISGGGHADSHLCENGIYLFDTQTLRFSVAVPRSPMNQALKQSATGQFEAILNPYDPRQESANGPMADGHVGATHTYDTIDFVPPTQMGNARGGLVMFAGSVHVYDLDTQRSDVPFYDARVNGNVDLSYKISFLDGWHLFHARANFFYREWDLRPTTRTATQWSDALDAGSLSRGAFVRSFSAGANFVYNFKSLAKMPTRREVAVFSAGQKLRVRVGAAVDANNFTDWNSFTDVIQLNSQDGSHLDFNDPQAYRDDNGGFPLFAAGFAHDAAGDRLWLTTNALGGDTYEVTGLAGSTWQTRKLVGPRNLSRSPNGTYGRMQVFSRGADTFLIRVTNVYGFAEIMRVQ